MKVNIGWGILLDIKRKCKVPWCSINSYGKTAQKPNIQRPTPYPEGNTIVMHSRQ